VSHKALEPFWSRIWEFCKYYCSGLPGASHPLANQLLVRWIKMLTTFPSSLKFCLHVFFSFFTTQCQILCHLHVAQLHGLPVLSGHYQPKNGGGCGSTVQNSIQYLVLFQQGCHATDVPVVLFDCGCHCGSRHGTQLVSE